MADFVSSIGGQNSNLSLIWLCHIEKTAIQAEEYCVRTSIHSNSARDFLLAYVDDANATICSGYISYVRCATIGMCNYR